MENGDKFRILRTTGCRTAEFPTIIARAALEFNRGGFSNRRNDGLILGETLLNFEQRRHVEFSSSYHLIEKCQATFFCHILTSFDLKTEISFREAMTPG